MGELSPSETMASSSAMTDYYGWIDDQNIQRSFKNLDHPAHLENFIYRIQGNLCRTFIADFSDSAAYAAFDLPIDSISCLQDASMPETNARWINVFYPQLNKPLLEMLARRYDFSPRLLALMCSEPPRTQPPSPTKHADNVHQRHRWARTSRRSASDSHLEKALGDFDELSEQSSINSHDSIAGGNLYRIVDNIWHYSSVDFGRNYLCIGYNSLYGTKHAAGGGGDGLLPHCTRVWTWLVLCEDNTVISISEDPFPNAEGRLDPLQQRILQESRRNLVNVFRSLSRVDEHDLMAQNPMTVLPIRTRLGDTPEETAHRESDAPGLLLYYLFENWQNSYTLVTRKESRYGVELANLRAQMFESPQLRHIDRLDSIAKELGVLKRHYQSYARIVDRLIEPQTATPASLQNSHVVSTASQTSLNTVRPLITEKESLLGVSLSSAARVRFKRLKDLIDLYALSEVEEYIKQKDSLITMNFNLIAMKESLAMERLTRVTLLITKATILFLPVSLMSAYFSTQLQGTEYTVTQYWVSFAVVLFLSWMALFVFGLYSGSVQTWEFFEGLKGGLQGTAAWIASGFRRAL